jgi:hypothetical protein
MDRVFTAMGVLAPVAVALVLGASPALAASSGSGGDSAFFNNCSEARAAGQTNIPQTQSSYRRALDRDGDGIACETNEGSAGTTNGQSTGSSGSLSGGGSASVRINSGTGGQADRTDPAVPAAVGGLGVLVLGASVIALRRRSDPSRG